jgi:hypothetical protein
MLMLVSIFEMNEWGLAKSKKDSFLLRAKYFEKILNVQNEHSEPKETATS